MPSGDIYKLDLFTHTIQRQFINTSYYELGTPSPADPFDEAEALAEAWTNNVLAQWSNILSSGTTIGCIKVSKVLGDEIPTFVFNFTVTFGARAAAPMPPNLAAIVTRRGSGPSGPIRSLLSISGISEADTSGSFLEATFLSGAMNTFAGVLNNAIQSTSTFQLANWIPVVPNTPRVYLRKVAVTANASTNGLNLDDGSFWSVRGFVTGPKFSILKPSPNRGTYNIIVTPNNSQLSLVGNNLEESGTELMNAQQAVGPTEYFTLQTSNIQPAIRQLNRRRSSHTGRVFP